MRSQPHPVEEDLAVAEAAPLAQPTLQSGRPRRLAVAVVVHHVANGPTEANKATKRIVRKVVDAHDGRIDIQTGAHGTRFRVTLPVSGANDWFVPKPGLPRSLTDD